MQIYILRGGLWGFDGPVTSAGMDALAHTIAQQIGVAPRVYNWNDWFTVAEIIRRTHTEEALVLIGYSGGGTRAILLANDINPRKVDLLILYDPSPRWQMVPIKSNVIKAINYYNSAPFMPSFFGMLGGGCLAHAPNVEIVTTAEQHLMIQNDANLHARTLAAIKDIHSGLK